MDTVQVAVRIRPAVNYEIEKGCRSCLETIPGCPQVVTKISNHSFTFNYVFDQNSSQEEIYEAAVRKLVLQLYKGYNVTILAYGQTGSGKTYTMGTNYTTNDNKGIIPRAVDDIFETVRKDSEWEFKIKASFIELYNEQLFDLLANRPRDQCVVDLREDSRGICIPGLTEVEVASSEDTLRCLEQGSLGRATGATAMNAQSSRSHAIFTIYIHQSKIGNESEAMTAKFHLVDLAGSERSKKTKAVGERFKEGVHINKGLLVLGNVISALGESNHNYISYRDSKLTRLLQDSLGGNSLTLMIACVSPADENHDETISTLRYADRAKRIKNKPIVNQDPKVAEISRLRRENDELRLELLAQKGNGSCPPEHAKIIEEYDMLVQKNKKLTDALNDALTQSTNMYERALIAEAAKDRMKIKLAELNAEYSTTLETVNQTLDKDQLNNLRNLQCHITALQEEQKRCEDEILEHDRALCIKTPDTSPTVNKISTPNESQSEDLLLREQHILQQAELNKELQELTKNLFWKEELMAKLAVSSSQFSELKCDINVKEMESQIEALQREKEELTQQIKNMQNNNTSSKLAEQRRKRLQELEQKISQLTKKVTEQERVIKMKEKSDEKINNLRSEIMEIKQAKVRLINQMKSEGEKYRAWRLEREREVCKLRQQDRQRQNQIAKMEHLHLRQQNVLKRKVEEAAAINKKLKEALTLQKNAQDRRMLQGKPVQIAKWVAQELDVLFSTFEAERTLESLIQDRATLSKDLVHLRKCLEDPNLNADDKTKLENEIWQLNNDLDLRSTQIMDLKQKIEDSDQENKAKTRWDTVQSMVDAKCALKYLFETAAEIKKDVARKDISLQELREAQHTVLTRLEEKERELKCEALKHQKEMQQLIKDYEDKVLTLLVRLQADREVKNGVDVFKGMEGTEVHENVDYWIQRCKDLEAELDKIKPKKTVLKPVNKNQDPVNQIVLNTTFISNGSDNEDDEALEDDEENDPSWRKTPIYRRLQSLKRGSKILKDKAVKRSNDGLPKCSCRGNCLRRLCSCRKMASSCSSQCRCNSDICENKENTDKNVNTSPSDELSEESDSSYKKPRFPQFSSPAIKNLSNDELNVTYTET